MKNVINEEVFEKGVKQLEKRMKDSFTVVFTNIDDKVLKEVNGFETYEEASEFAKDELVTFDEKAYYEIKDNTRYYINWFEGDLYLFNEGEFETIEEADIYADQHMKDITEYNGRPVNQELLSYTVEACEPEVLVEDEKYDYDKDYAEEDFKEITEEELEEDAKNEEIAKYFDGNTMFELMPKELFEEFVKEKADKLEDIEFKYGKYSILISYPFYLDDCYGIYINNKIIKLLTLDELYDTLVNIDEEYSKLLSEDERIAKAVEDLEKEIKAKIEAVNENTTLKELAQIECSIDVYSDIYKDANNFRPRAEIAVMHKEIQKRNPKLYEELVNLPYNEYCELIK